MIYLIVEDIKSGYEFWVSVNKILFSNKVKILTGAGARNLMLVVKGINLKENDELIIIMDNLGSNETYDILRKIISYSRKRKVEPMIADLYCTEEIFLSFPKLERWCKVKRVTLLKYVRECIIEGIDYHDIPNEELYDFKKDNMKSDTDGQITHLNKETLAALLLSNITHGTVFSTAQKSYSLCWHCDCCDREDLGYRRKSCNLFEEDNYLTGKEKLQSILDNLTKLEIIDVDYITELINETESDYEMIYYNEMLSGEGYTFKYIETVHKEMRDEEIESQFGQDLFEQVYNYLYNNPIEKPRTNTSSITLPKIKSFGL